MRIPNVPHDVPVENARKQATTNMMAGKNAPSVPAPFTMLATNSLAPRSEVIFLSAVANVRMRIAGTIAINPFGTASIDSLKETALRIIK